MNIEIYNNKFNFKLNQLVEIGKRSNNSKRNFLFISKLLGKHICVRPDTCKAAGHLLASMKFPELYSSDIINYLKGEEFNISSVLNKTTEPANKILVIGFAETATGLGMAVASKLKGCIYQTTTREPITGLENILNFEEEHSHATTHKIYSILDYNFNDFDEIILVDDEITTGNSMLNLIKEISEMCNVKHFNVLTILDWRSEAQINKYKDFCTKENLVINVYSVLSGNIENKDQTVYQDETEVKVLNKTVTPQEMESDFAKVDIETENGVISYLKNSGRFGVKQHHIENIERHAMDYANQINNMISPDCRVLVLGHGENIYIPSRIASYINAKVEFRTTTRSPILCDGKIINSKNVFFDNGVKYFFYNKEDIESMYDFVFLIAETPFNIELANNMVILEV